jgi:hypothetical protein
MKRGFGTAIASFLAALGAAKSSGTGQELTDGFNIDVTWDEKSEIVTFTAVIPNKTWMGIVIGNYSMVNSDMILFSANGSSSRFYDLYSDGYFMPMEDDHNDLTGSFEVLDTEVRFKV